jgi:hypothetical protein
MMSKRTAILFLLVAYLIAMGCWTYYYADHFPEFVHRKGDEFTSYVTQLLLSSIVVQSIVSAMLGLITWKVVLLGTIGNVILSFVVGLMTLLASGLSGIPRHLILVYGLCYMAFFAASVVFQALRSAPRS